MHKNDELKNLIEQHNTPEAMPSQEQLQAFQKSFPKRARREKTMKTLGLLSFAALAFISLNLLKSAEKNTNKAAYALTEEEAVFFDEMLALEPDEGAESDEDFYIYSDLMTL